PPLVGISSPPLLPALYEFPGSPPKQCAPSTNVTGSLPLPLPALHFLGLCSSQPNAGAALRPSTSAPNARHLLSLRAHIRSSFARRLGALASASASGRATQ